MRLARLIAAAALLALAAPVAAETLAAVDLSRTVLGMEGRDRGRPRPIMLTIGLDRAVPHRIALVDNPPRLVIDLQGAVPPEGQTSADPLALRWGPAPQGGARAILTLPGPMKLDSVQMRAVPAPSLALRLLPVAPDAFQPRPDALTVLRGLPQPADTGADRNALADDRLRVVLDPGHGGIDPGAQVGAISEAAVMLGFAQELAATLRGRGIEVVLTREDDRFIPLERRTTVARAKGADLFISLHADALPAGEAAGASIYAWDGQSNDRAARQLALMHDRSDILAGLDLSDTDEDVSRALMDLARLDTQPRSLDAARHLVAKMNEAGVVMHRTPIRGAAFSVLKSPDIPSLLIELGFLTHPQDRANLFDPVWRQRVAEAMTDGILAWAADQDAQGPLAAPRP
ncbi:N-acetylmuramoyl-L-alanine amidase [Paracoccus sp. (in: a-proteobacteria)]|uniref:N-acetylmuramoyl-L-alanine amidase n=1 Tax=Paracoccus sp. TaxID=267 RepID=UPI0026DF9E2A|nr:N-acetylmuramoyl-L-alanine amidase [Paracoccus sp. (in: a-proteobacteria)]MDO5369970.1 N-acetylmuramoyl-L-alanine amidase [Paracoccus sp. (in: a-proteobacteria)]